MKNQKRSTPIHRQLRQHQWKAFKRHPMFEKNMGIKIFMFLMFGILALEFLVFGFYLDKLCLEIGQYTLAIDCFNSGLLYVFMGDFLIKFVLKKSHSMQIAPYLTLPVKRNRLFDFLLVKEFSNLWNLYLLFLVVPLSLKSIPPFFGWGSTVIYILFFYLLCVANSLLVRIADNTFKQNTWFILLPAGIMGGVLGLAFGMGISFGEYTQLSGEWILNKNYWVWIGLAAVFFLLWRWNQVQMRNQLYREMQGEKSGNAVTVPGLPFLDRLGEVGRFITLDIKMILRAKRLRSQLFALGFMIVYCFFLLYAPVGKTAMSSLYLMIFFFVFIIGGLGLIMGQYLFLTESSSFDGLMARNHSLLNMLRAKYLLYSSYAVFGFLLLLIPVFHGKIDLLFLIALFFFTIGFFFFLIFQNAVYNKSYLDLFEGGMMNWKGTSGSMLMITMLSLFIPAAIIRLIAYFSSPEIANYTMLGIGLLFTIFSDRWIKSVYKRFMKRRYKNMEGFRSNG